MNLKKILVCPKCKSQLARQHQYFECIQCLHQYPIFDDIPVFVTGDSPSDSMSEFWDMGWQHRLEESDQMFLLNENAAELKARLLSDIEILLKEQDTIADALPIDEKILLNVGCGTGEAPLFTLMGAGNYIGIDYSFKAVKYSFDNIKKLGGTGITAQANAETLPIEENSIDVVFSNGVLHHTPKTEKAVDEIYRVLKPSGKAIIGLYNTWSPHFINDRIIGTLKGFANRSYRKWYEFGEGAWRTGDCVNPWTKTYSRAELVKLFSKYDTKDLCFRKAGFSWGNAIPKLGKYIDKTGPGRRGSRFLHSKIGGMWVITFFKR